jgi:hypothetical protein
MTRHGERTLSNLFETYTRQQLEGTITHVVMPILDLAAVHTADWYASLDPSSRYNPTDVQTAVNDGRINYTLAWSFGKDADVAPVDRMAGAFQRMVFDASRNVVISNAKLEKVPWFRDAREDACSFCRLLTVNPHAYHGKYVEMPSHNHDCRCLAVVSRGENAYQEPPYVQQWRREVQANRTGNLTEKLAGMDAEHV